MCASLSAATQPPMDHNSERAIANQDVVVPKIAVHKLARELPHNDVLCI
jgi:hypothetical protein